MYSPEKDSITAFLVEVSGLRIQGQVALAVVVLHQVPVVNIPVTQWSSTSEAQKVSEILYVSQVLLRHKIYCEFLYIQFLSILLLASFDNNREYTVFFSGIQLIHLIFCVCF